MKATYQDLFEYLENELCHTECDRTLRLTEQFAEGHKLPFRKLSKLLGEMGAFCDCEVVLNVPNHAPPEEVIGEETFETPLQAAINRGLYAHCRINSKPVSFAEASAAKGNGIAVKWWVPCTEHDPFAIPDTTRAIEESESIRCNKQIEPRKKSDLPGQMRLWKE